MTLRGDIRGRTCKLCKNDFRKTCPEIKRLTEENENLLHENTNLRGRIYSTENQLATNKGDTKNESLQELGGNRPQPLQDSLREEISACLREERQREKKSLNLCIWNFPESEPM